jgi:hypothetical protein
MPRLSKAYVDAITRDHVAGTDNECLTRPVKAVRFGSGHKRGSGLRIGHATTRSMKSHLRSQARLMKFRQREETGLLRSCPMPRIDKPDTPDARFTKP